MAVIGYLGNKNLKGGLVQISWTKEMLAEYSKCAEDPIYFIENHMKIVNLNKGLQLFEPYDYQKKTIETIHENRFTCCLFPRQSGKCLYSKSFINIRNKMTGEIKKLTVEDFYNLEKQK
jgi:hypothetical protein